MGADNFVAYYGLRFEPSEEELEELESKVHRIFKQARKAKLKVWWGRLTEGAPDHLLLGTELGVFGVEGDSSRSIPEPELTEIMSSTRRKLQQAGYSDEPALHFQLEAQY